MFFFFRFTVLLFIGLLLRRTREVLSKSYKDWVRIAFVSAVDHLKVLVIDLVVCIITSCWGNVK